MWKTLVLLFAICSGFSCHPQPQNPEDVVLVRELPESVPQQSQRIMGGSAVANLQMYPYIVQVIRNNQLVCGGSLLTTRAILSAAHCFTETNGSPSDRRQFTIRAGTVNLNSGGQTQSVSNIINHEQYTRATREHDIAIVITSGRFTINNDVRQAALAGNDPADNATVTHIGWGSTFFSLNPNAPAPPSTILQQVAVFVVNRNQCANNYNYLNTQATPGGPFWVSQNMICTGIIGTQGVGACTGDEGGPVVLNGLIVGITSWGFNCGESNYPRVNTRINSYLQWINATVQRNSSPVTKVNVVILLASLISALRFV
ncbi:trypsin domain-containing protein [Phthorimaea operculella]|nr:trypsin domain-containing protein [Phthorimaea operculella]